MAAGRVAMIRIILSVTNRTRAHPGSGCGVRWRRGRALGDWRGVEWEWGRGPEAGRPGGSLLPKMTRTPSFSFPAFELLYSHPNLAYPFLYSPLHPAVFPPPVCVAKHGHAIRKGVAMHFPK